MKIFNPKVFHVGMDTIKNDESLYTKENHDKKMKAVMTFSDQRTALGTKNLLIGITMHFDGEYGGERQLIPEISHIRAFDGWPKKIIKEVEEIKKND